MRIISGKFKGIALHGPKDKKIRPLKDMVRESVFNLLSHSNKISFKLEKSNILDLYAGTGSFWLELISRNAKNVFFVENKKEAIKTLEKNIKKLNVSKNTQIMSCDVFKFLKERKNSQTKFDLIFCDPPFKIENIEKLIELIFNSNLLSKKGTIILHRNKGSIEKFPHNFETIEERIYGISKIIFGKFLI